MFDGGSRIAAWLDGQIGEMHRAWTALERLEHLRRNTFLRLDHRYAIIVDKLVEAMRPYRDAIPEGAREKLKSSVRDALKEIPPIYIQSHELSKPASDWYWTYDDGVRAAARFVGDDYVVARNAELYELFPNGDMKGEPTIITRDAAGRRCSLHPLATANEPCWEINLILDITNGGKPITEAIGVLVRNQDNERESGRSPAQ